MPLLDLEYWKIHSFPHFSFTCFDISGWNFTYDFVLLYFRSSSSVVNFRHFFYGVIPLSECKILKIHSFLHFSLTRFDILSWNFAYDSVLLYYRLSLSFLNFRWFLWELCPFWKSEYWKYTVFCSFLLHALTYWAEILHMSLFNCTIDHVWVLSIFVGVMPLFGTKNTQYTVLRTFLLHALTYWAKILHITLFYCNSDQVRVSSICVNFCGSNAPFGT